MILAIIQRDLKLAFGNLSQFFNQIIFFFIALSIFAISFNKLEAEDNLSWQISAIWFCLVFSIIVGIGSFLKKDYEDGTLEQILISFNFFEIFIITRFFTNWLISSVPLIIFTPIAALILKIEAVEVLDLIIISTITTLIVNLIACFCASLTVSCNKNESLLTILILPLVIPVIIFANSAFFNLEIENFTNSIFFLTLIFIFLLPILTFLSSIAIKISVRN